MGGHNARSIEATGDVEVIEEDYCYNIFNSNGTYVAKVFKPIEKDVLDSIVDKFKDK